MTSPRKLIPETGRLLIVLARAGQVLTAVSVLGVAWVLFRIALPALPNDQGAVDVLRHAFSESSMAFVNGWYLLRASLYKIGRASGRERVCQYGLISVVAVSLKKK